MLSSLWQGRNIYDGCCQLDIQFSKYALLAYILHFIVTFIVSKVVLSIDWSFIFSLEELQVNYNNDRSRYSLCSLLFDVIFLFI